jgi:ubiquitin-like 1-activating enzyme E1 B
VPSIFDTIYISDRSLLTSPLQLNLVDIYTLTNYIVSVSRTNAICAGLQILQVFKILKLIVGKKDGEELNLKQACSYVNCLRNRTRNGLFLTASELEAPNPKCFVCRNADIPVSLSVKDWTLGQFIEKICKAKLGLEQPTIMLNGDMIWEEGEDADTEAYQSNVAKKLPDLPCGGIHHGTVVELEDFSQDLTIQLNITNKENWDDENESEEFPFHVGGQVPKPKTDDATKAPPEASAKVANASEESNADDDDDVVLVVDEMECGDKKRSAVHDGEAIPAAKKAKMDEIISVDDD